MTAAVVGRAPIVGPPPSARARPRPLRMRRDGTARRYHDWRVPATVPGADGTMV